MGEITLPEGEIIQDPLFALFFNLKNYVLSVLQTLLFRALNFLHSFSLTFVAAAA